MTRSLWPFCLVVAMAAPLCAQQAVPADPVQLRQERPLPESPKERAARLKDFANLFRKFEPQEAASARLVMPQGGDVVRLRVQNDTLELFRDGPGGADEACGRWVAQMGGRFTAAAVGPDDLVVAMQTGNAKCELTVLHFARADRTHDFVYSAGVVVDTVAWKDPEAPTGQALNPERGDVIAWDAASRVVTMAFAWRAIDQCVKSEFELVSFSSATEPEAGGRRRRRVVSTPESRQVRAELVGAGAGVTALEVDAALHVFTRRPDGPGRSGPMRVHVRDRKGHWTLPATDIPQVRLEPEFAVWRDAEGRVCVTTPATAPRGDLGNPTAEPVQTLRTFRMDPKDAAQWTLAPTQFPWSGRLKKGQPIQIEPTQIGGWPGRVPSVVLQTEAGEMVEQRGAAVAPRIMGAAQEQPGMAGAEHQQDCC